ncbi:hypothetical protein [Kribbella qitaiheensis]|uniref:hypothetical protein n=1 Tax=Kribbella qitaiheensis TaxID=1544730 RepID=UPI0019D5C499|nr:hypothetical protein [Kribbella qitaiheensis]
MIQPYGEVGSKCVVALADADVRFEMPAGGVVDREYRQGVAEVAVGARAAELLGPVRRGDGEVEGDGRLFTLRQRIRERYSQRGARDRRRTGCATGEAADLHG